MALKKFVNYTRRFQGYWLAGLGAIFISWLYFPVLCAIKDPQVFLPRDNFHYQFPLFEYIVLHIKSFLSFPSWVYTPGGGMWIEPLMNNYMLILPHRILGYLIALFPGISANFSYKFSLLIFGTGFYLAGLFYLIRTLFKDRLGAIWFILLATLTPLTITFIHQEQALGTIFFIPLIWISLIFLNKDGRSLFPLAAFTGMSLNSHYPQIIFIYFFVLSIAALLTWSETACFIKTIFRNIRRTAEFWCALSLVGFLLSASPLIFAYVQFKDDLVSSKRGQAASVAAMTFKEYQQIHKQAKSSIKPENFLLYAGLSDEKIIDMRKTDSRALYMTSALPLAILFVLIFPVPYRKFQLLSIFFLFFLCMGIYGPAPKGLWHIIPGIRMFRQWYHFIHLLNFHLAFLVFISLRSLMNLKIQDGNRIRLLLLILALIALAFYKKTDFAFTLIPGLILLGYLLGKTFWAIKRNWLTGILLIWLLGHSSIWMSECIDLYQSQWFIETGSGAVRHRPFRQERILDHFITHRTRAVVAQIRQVDRHVFSRLFSKGHFFWVSKDRKRTEPIRKEDLHIETAGGGFRITLAEGPPWAAEFLFLQYNDGRWITRDFQGHNYQNSRGAFGAVEIPLQSLSLPQTFLISREPTVWNIFIWICWLPLIVSAWIFQKINISSQERARE